MAQTKEGFMWFGTQDGLNRFDGKNFYVVQPARDNAKNNDFGRYSKMITALYADNNDCLWVGTTQEVALYNRYVNKFMLPAEIFTGFALPQSPFIIKIIEDKKNNIWILTKNDGLYCYSKTQKKMLPLHWQGGR